MILLLFITTDLCGSDVEGDATEGAKTETGDHGQSDQQYARKTEGTLGLDGIIPLLESQTRVQ